jgi:hypothetical protein
MKVRKMDSEGDYSFGHGELDFYTNSPEGVAQNVSTRLQLWKGSWFIDTEEGTPWLQEILGKHDAVDVVIRNRILETPGVQSIQSFEWVLDPDTRVLNLQATLNTIYGSVEILESI